MELKVFKGDSWRIHLFNPSSISEKTMRAHSECSRVLVWRKIDPKDFRDIGNRGQHNGGHLFVKLQDYEDKHHEFLCPQCIGNAVKHGFIKIEFV